MRWVVNCTKLWQQPAQPMHRHCESPSLHTLDNKCVVGRRRR